MKSENIKKRVLSYGPWEPWLKRPFFAFLVSLFSEGQTKAWFNKIGVNGLEYPCSVFYNGEWYKSEKNHEATEKSLEIFLQKHHISEITDSLENYYIESKKNILKLIGADKLDLSEKLNKIYLIIIPIISYIWATHALEHLMVKKLHIEVPRYVKRNVEDFIAKASSPEKKVAHNRLEDALRSGRNPADVAAEFGWIRARDGFARPFTVKEILEMKKQLKKSHRPKVKIPSQLKPLFSNAKELVYLRTQRTDVFYELLFLARPVFREAAERYRIPFSEMKHYTIQSLIAGKPKRYPKNFVWANYLDHSAFFTQSFLPKQEINRSSAVQGVPTQKGIVRGVVKIIFSVNDLPKVKQGDVIVA